MAVRCASPAWLELRYSASAERHHARLDGGFRRRGWRAPEQRDLDLGRIGVVSSRPWRAVISRLCRAATVSGGDARTGA
jgi:hypothetical protein